LKTWIVVAHRGGARIVSDQEDKLRVLETMDNPDGSPSRRGRNRPSAPDSHGHRAPPPRESQREHAANAFAGKLADKLLAHRNRHSYDELVLIAPPHFLGALRHALDDATATTVRGTLDKDFGRLSDHELLRRLDQI